MSLIPDTLTIFITTKIPSYIDFIYNSKNTLPDTNTSVLMNPLIVLKSEITNPNILFDKTLFEIQLREDRLAKIPTLIQATKDNFISKNIKTILTVLFAKGKVIYLGDYPFTIHNMTWNGNWSIQHKFSTSLTNIKEYLLANEKKIILENNLLNSLPLEVRTNNDKDYFLQYLTNLYLIKGSIAEPITNKELFVNDNDLGINNILKSIKLDKLPNNLQFIINNYRSNYLIYISGIYYNLTTDPLILILFYTEKTYNDSPENYINIPKYIHQNVYLEELFNIFKEKRILLNTTNYNFWNIWKNLSYQQKTIEDLYKELSKMFAKTPTLNYSNVERIMNNIEISQKEFFKLFVIYFQSFLNTLYAQKSYYKSTLLFLEELNNVYSGNILNVQLNIENEQLIIQADIKIFQCIVEKFEKPYTPPTSKVSSKNIITCYKEVYDKYIKIIFNLMKLKSYIFFNKIKEDRELIDFYIFQNYKLNLLILSNYEYLKTYINDCLQDYKDLLINHNSSSFMPSTSMAKGLALPPPPPPPPPPKIDIDKIKKDLDDLDKENKDLKLKIAEAEKIKLELAKLEADKKKLEAEKKKLEAAGGLKDRRLGALALEIDDKNRRILALEGDVRTLRAAQDILIARITAQQAQMVVLRAMFQNLSDSNNTLRGEIARLTGQLALKDRIIGNYRAYIERLIRDKVGLQARVTDLETEKTRLERENTAQLDEIRLKDRTIAVQTRQIEDLRLHIEFNKVLVERFRTSNAQAKALSDAQIADLTAQITTLRDQIVQKDTELATLRTQHQAELAACQRTQRDLREQLATLQGQNATLQGQNTTFQRTITTLQARVRDLETIIETLQRDKTTLETTNERLLQNIIELRQQLENLTRIQTTLGEENDRLKSDNRGLIAENNMLRDENDTLKAVNVAKLAENERLLQENERLRQQNAAQRADFDRQLAALQQQLTNVQAQLATATQRLADTQRQLDVQNERVAEQQRELDENTQQLALSTAELDARNAYIEGLNKKIGELTKQLHEQVLDQTEHQAQIDKYKGLLREKFEQETLHITSIDGLKANLRDLEEKQKRLMVENEVNKVKLSQNEEVLHNTQLLQVQISGRLSLANAKLAASDSSLKAEKAKTKILQDQIGGLQEQIRQKDEEKRRQDDEITLLRNTVGRLQADLDEIERNRIIQEQRLRDLAGHIFADKSAYAKYPEAKIEGGNPLFTKMAGLDLTRITDLGDKIISGIKNSVKKFIDKSIVDNYLTSLHGNITLYNKLAPLTTYDNFIKKMNSIKTKSKALVPQDDQEYYQFKTNSILTYSMIILIIYVIQIILFQYLNYNSSCLNYFIIQKEYSTFNYLYTQLYYKKLKEDNTFSIPFSIQTYNFDNNIVQLQSKNIEFFEEIIYCNSLICEYSIVYNQVNSQVNKLFSNITPELSQNMLIIFCNISSSSVLDINNDLFQNYIFRNKINDIIFGFLDTAEYKETLLFQQYLLDIVDSGVYLNFLPKEEYISVNNWWVTKINLGKLNQKFDKNKDNLNEIIKFYEILFYNEYNQPNNLPYLLLDYTFICSEIKLMDEFKYIEMLGNDNLRIKLFHFCKAHILLEGIEEFNFNDIILYTRTILSKDVTFTKKNYTINNLYNTLFPNYFSINELLFNQIYNLVTITTDDSAYEAIVNALYNLYYNVEDLDKLENKLNPIYLRIDKMISNNDHYKDLLKKISELNIYCSDNLLEYTLIILIYLLQRWNIGIVKKPLKLKKEDVVFEPVNYFLYQNLIDNDRYYYIIQNSLNNYEIGDELINKSTKKIYIILNKFTFTSETKFQIISSEYVNITNLSIFNSKVEIISLDLHKYTLRKTSPLKIINKYYNQDIRKKITFIYENNRKFYLLNNLCLYSSQPNLKNIDLNTQFDMQKLDNYMIYFLFYKLILFNPINCIQYKTSIKNYCLIGLNNIDLRNYDDELLINNNYFKYIKTYYQNILYFYIINYYIEKNEKIDMMELNLLAIYKIIKLHKLNFFEKEKSKIEAELKRKLRKYLIPKYRGGVGDSIVKTGATPRINITTPITKDSKDSKDDKDKINKVELLIDSPFSYFIHIELDLYPGKLSEEEAEKGQSLLKSLSSSCRITQKNIEKNIADIRNVPYKQSSFTPKELLKMDPTFPINKFIPNYIEPLDKKEQKKKKKRKRKKKKKEKEKKEKREKKEKKEKKKKKKKKRKS